MKFIFLFESADVLSPSFVSRCNVLYLDSDMLSYSSFIKSYVNDNGDESGEGSGPLQEVNALKYTVPLTNEVVIGIILSIEAENVSEVLKFMSFETEAVISIGGLKPDCVT